MSAINSSSLPSPPHKPSIIVWTWCVAAIASTPAETFLPEVLAAIKGGKPVETIQGLCNRRVSWDSRFFGAIRREAFVGRILMR